MQKRDNHTEKYWRKALVDENFENVLSITEDVYVQDKIIKELTRHKKVKKILIPGCGSKSFLQNAIDNRIHGVEMIVCTDFESIINVVRTGNTSEKIVYKVRDSTNLDFENCMDSIIIINSILSESHAENQSILLSCFEALKPKGIFMGFFPTIFAPLDAAYLIDNKNLIKMIDIKSNVFHEKKQKVRQIFYTPLRLRNILKRVGFNLVKMELFFFESEYIRHQIKSIYEIDDPDIVAYELFIVAEK